ncbi:lysozyme [Haemophilus parahaemolyticus]|uniref:lysozyme n=1 Tax=Haemophilus parahaemolyticus TaxID=735 RepID=UPI000DACF535|nr:lysozyme [Haemophilus parahaemolyticus]RDE82803.1 lysozyme [Haemophilus parahaemolyticus]
MYKLSEKSFELLKRFEGCKLTAYQDSAKVWTIGYGHTHNVKAGMNITQAQADAFLQEDVAKFEQGISQTLRELGTKVTQNQFDALVIFSFNVGLRAFQKSTMAKKLYLMDNKDQLSVNTVADQFPRWNKAGGQVLPSLVKRRAIERLLFLGVEA